MDRSQRSPYVVEVTLRSCTCQGPVQELSRHRKYSRAVPVAAGYWNVYVAFFGDLYNIVHYSIVDIRDGAVLWRNGRHTKEGVQRGKAEQGSE